MKEGKGVIIIFTGAGKGKTSAALGVALRASGHGMNTLIIEFMKERGGSGEQNVCPQVMEHIEIHPFGMGFMLPGDDRVPYVELVEKAWIFMEERLQTRKYQFLILDELNVVLSMGLLSINKVIEFLDKKDVHLHVIITGRNAPQELLQLADIVTEMKEIKHHYREGKSAVRGLDF